MFEKSFSFSYLAAPNVIKIPWCIPSSAASVVIKRLNLQMELRKIK